MFIVTFSERRWAGREFQADDRSLIFAYVTQTCNGWTINTRKIQSKSHRITHVWLTPKRTHLLCVIRVGRGHTLSAESRGHTFFYYNLTYLYCWHLQFVMSIKNIVIIMIIIIIIMMMMMVADLATYTDHILKWFGLIMSTLIWLCRPTVYVNRLIGTLKSHSNGSLYSNTMIDGGLLHLLQRAGAWVGCGPAQSPHRCTKCNSPLING